MKGNAQNLNQIGKEKPVSLAGGVSLNQVFYSSFGSEERRDPYSYIASGSLNVSIYGWSVPLSFTLSNQSRSFQQPFNQYSIHPTYKSIRAHIGNVSASYSPYSVNGHNFLGAAVDYEPEGKLQCSALYGRFLRAVRYDSAINNLPSYERIGYGAKVQFMHENNLIQLTIFHGEDNHSFLGHVPDSLIIHRQENMVVSLAASTVLASKFLLKGEVAGSGVSTDLNAAPETRDHFISKLSPIYTSRISTSFYNAVKADLDYQLEVFTIGLGYERVDPGYKTFGSYYFNNDLENITVNASTSMLSGKVSIATSIGVQHDNLDKSKMSTLKRSVGSVNVSYAPSDKLTFAGSYSSFQSFTNIQSRFQELNQLSPYENIDTLNFTQLSRSGNFNAAYSFGQNAEQKQSFNFSASAQGASERQGDVVQNSGAWFYNFNSAYSVNFQPQALTLSIAFNGGINDTAFETTSTYGPVISVSRSFFEKKLRANGSINYVRTSNASNTGFGVVSVRMGGGLKLAKVHNVNLTAVALQRQSGQASFLEMTLMLGYSYSFSSRNKD